jgi:hypothetical protein
MRKVAWRHAVKLAPAYAAGWSMRRRVQRELDELMKGPGRVLREAMSHPGSGPLVLFACFHDFRQQIKYDLAFGAALAAQGANVAVLTRADCTLVRRYWTAVGKADAVHALQILPSGPRPQLAGREIDVKALLDLRYRGVSVGRWALATAFSKLRKSYSELQEPGALAVVATALDESYAAADAAHEALDRINPAKIVFLEKGYSPAGELFEAALEREIDVVQYVHGHASSRLLVKRFGSHNRFQHPAEPSPALWSGVQARPADGDRTEAVRRRIREAYESGEWFNRKYGQAGKQLRSRDELTRELGLDPSRPTAVIFTHVGWDATFFYGQNLFTDYDEWLTETVRAAAQIPGINWLVRVHPDNLWKAKASHRAEDLDRDHRLVERTLGGVPANVRWLGPSSDVRTDSLFDVADVCLTVRGTIGLEMACMGKHVVTAGTGRYSGYGFTLDSTTRDEYFARLRQLASLPPPSPDRADLAARYVDTLIRERPIVMVSAVDRRLPPELVGTDPMGDDVDYRFSSVADLLAAPDLAPLARWILHSADQDLVVTPCAG